MPNTKVRIGAALGAAVAAASAWVAAGVGFTQLVAYSTQLMTVYAGFAIVLLALMWVWLNWLIILTGALLAFYLQHPEYLRSGEREVLPTVRLRERLALSVMYLVVRAFESGERRCSVATLADALAVPSGALGPLVDALERAGIVESTEGEALLPAKDPARITLHEVLAAVRDGGSGRALTLTQAAIVAPAEEVCGRIDAAIRRELGDRSLRDFAATGTPPAAG